MYCNCIKPNIVINSAYGESFKVCASSKGGCGLEYKDSPKTVPIDTKGYLRPFKDKDLRIDHEWAQFLQEEGLLDKFISMVDDDTEDDGFWIKISDGYIMGKDKLDWKAR